MEFPPDHFTGQAAASRGIDAQNDCFYLIIVPDLTDQIPIGIRTDLAVHPFAIYDIAFCIHHCDLILAVFFQAFRIQVTSRSYEFDLIILFQFQPLFQFRFHLIVVSDAIDQFIIHRLLRATDRKGIGPLAKHGRIQFAGRSSICQVSSVQIPQPGFRLQPVCRRHPFFPERLGRTLEFSIVENLRFNFKSVQQILEIHIFYGKTCPFKQPFRIDINFFGHIRYLIGPLCDVVAISYYKFSGAPEILQCPAQFLTGRKSIDIHFCLHVNALHKGIGFGPADHTRQLEKRRNLFILLAEDLKQWIINLLIQIWLG